MKNYKQSFDLLQIEEQRYIEEKAIEYQKKLKFDMSNDGWNDATDAFRHVWGAAYLALKYNKNAAKIATNFHEISEKGQPGAEKNMDLHNNDIGFGISDSIQKDFPNPAKSFKWSQIEDMIALKAYEKLKENKVITSIADKKINSKPVSLRENLIKTREEKLARYTKKLAESPEKTRAQEAKHVTLEELKASQNSRIQKVHDMIQNAQKKKDKKEPAGSGEVYVKEYTRSDGTKVKSYYRRR